MRNLINNLLGLAGLVYIIYFFCHAAPQPQYKAINKVLVEDENGSISVTYYEPIDKN